MKAIILARVSTEEQKDAGNSLPAQIERLKSYCKRKGFEIIRTYSFDESAYKTKRDEFDRILEYLETNKGKVAVCFDKVDRLSRNVFDKRVSLLYEKAVADEIELHFVSDGQVINSAMSAVQKFQFGMSLGLAKYYSDAISDNVKRAYEQKRRAGEWTGKAPIGYRNITDAVTGKRDIVFDMEKEALIRKIFELYATGNYSLKTIGKEITKAGLRSKHGKPLAGSMIEHILKNPFYYGEMRCNGQLYPHKYQPLISKELFEKCRSVREGWNKKPFQYAAKPYIFRGLLRCARCGCSMSPETKVKKSGLIFIYYSCTNARKELCDKKTYVPEEELLKPVYAVLSAFSRISQDVIDEVIVGLKKSKEAKMEYHNKVINSLRIEYDTIQTKIDRMLDLFIASSITKDIYDKKLLELKDRQERINIELEEHTKADENYYLTAGTVLGIAQNSLKLFEHKEAKVSEKRAFLNYLIKDAVVDENKKLTFVLRSPYNHILNFTEATIATSELKQKTAETCASSGTLLMEPSSHAMGLSEELNTDFRTSRKPSVKARHGRNSSASRPLLRGLDSNQRPSA